MQWLAATKPLHTQSRRILQSFTDILSHPLHSSSARNQTRGFSNGPRDWQIVPRVIPESVVRAYFDSWGSTTVREVLILNGPEGVGKRTLVKSLLPQWQNPPHFIAMADLNPQNQQKDKNASLATCVDSLESALKSLVANGVTTGQIDSPLVQRQVARRHWLQGALRATAVPAGSLSDQSEASSKAFAELALVEGALRVQDRWRLRGTEGPEGSGYRHWRGRAAWAGLMMDLLGEAALEDKFQPKLVINGVDRLRRAPAGSPPCELSAYHDTFLLRLLEFSDSWRLIPTLLLTSDSYYSHQFFSDFQNHEAVRSHEMFGWSFQEASFYLHPKLFNEAQWKVISGVLGGNPRQLAEFYRLWEMQGLMGQNFDELSAVDDCLDEYLNFLTDSVVDPAINDALDLILGFADKAVSGKLPPEVTAFGMPWRHCPPPQKPKQQRLKWARRQLADFVEAFAEAEFGVNYVGQPGLEFLWDPAVQALLQVGLLYQQRDPTYVRPTSLAFQRCLVRWLVSEKLSWTTSQHLQYTWHRYIRGRYYKHLQKH